MNEFIDKSGLLLFGVIIGITWFTIEAPDVMEASYLLQQAADTIDYKDEVIVDLEERLEACQNSQINSEQKPMSLDVQQVLNLTDVKQRPTFRKPKDF